jgi:hypothetical protein
MDTIKVESAKVFTGTADQAVSYINSLRGPSAADFAALQARVERHSEVINQHADVVNDIAHDVEAMGDVIPSTSAPVTFWGFAATFVRWTAFGGIVSTVAYALIAQPHEEEVRRIAREEIESSMVPLRSEIHALRQNIKRVERKWEISYGMDDAK